jgi:hypothetical protein
VPTTLTSGTEKLKRSRILALIEDGRHEIYLGLAAVRVTAPKGYV